jgi:MATE family multidrug resistance protein
MMLAGVLAGCGWQKIGAYVNLGSFYVIGVPCAIVLAFFVHMHAMVNFVVYNYIYNKCHILSIWIVLF